MQREQAEAEMVDQIIGAILGKKEYRDTHDLVDAVWPRWSTDMGAAWELVVRYHLHITPWVDWEGNLTWRVSPLPKVNPHYWFEQDESAPMAVCRVAIRLHNEGRT